ncbi:MAG: hypothetical protein FWE27_03545 [Defluviitaleaceae bacterium]|nr:hypothetical protein [Defluviitaleaceae bacterium]
MTGHHIYTRSWYEYDSRSKNPGTFTVELTSGLFEPNTSDVIYHKLNPVLAGTQPSIAGYDLEHSLLRIFHPTPDSTVVARSYFVNDEITKRGIVQYSFGLVFSNEANNRFLRFPKHAFELSAVEPYEEFVKRVSEEEPIEYSSMYDPNPNDYQQPTVFSREDLMRIGFNEDIFTKFFISLGKAITSQKDDQRVAVILPEVHTGEKIILAVLTILPPWLVGKFGAVSRWSGALEGRNSASINGIQLVFYSGEKPPHDTISAIIDLTNAHLHKNIEDITAEQQELAKWYWENIGKPDNLKSMADYMIEKYRQLMDKMPFPVFAHCFYLWNTFHLNNYDTKFLSFSMASRAINSIVSAFGKNLEKYFSNKFMLTSIFRIFIEQLESSATSQISESTVRSVCLLANNDFKAGDQLQARHFIKPMADRFFDYNEWIKLEPILQYYSKMLKDSASEENFNEAIAFFGLALLSVNKKLADDAAAVLSNYANASVAVMLAEGTNHVNEYKKIALLLKDAKRQMNLDISTWENVSKNEAASRMFFLLEKFNRENANINPPGNKQLDNVLNGIQKLQPSEKSDAIQTLLYLYWNADTLKDAAQMQKYVKYLHENQKLKLYLQNDIGTDDIREIFKGEVDHALDTREFISDDEKINAILEWLAKLRNDCGFPDSDPIFMHLGEKLTVLGGIDTICEVLSPKSIKTLAEVFKKLGATDKADMLYEIIKFDEAGGSKGDFSRIIRNSNVKYKYFLIRIEYWFNNSTDIPAEWALTRAVYEAESRNMALSYTSTTAEMYLNYRRDKREPKEDLIDLYEAMHLVDDGRYEHSISDDIFKSLKGKVFQIVNELEDRNFCDTLFATATKFKNFASPHSIHTRMYQAGREIANRIKNNYSSEDPPYDILKKFHPGEGAPMSFASDYSVLPSVLSFFIFIGVCLATVSGIILILSPVGLTGMLLTMFPLWFVTVLAVCMFISLVLTIFQLLYPDY